MSLETPIILETLLHKLMSQVQLSMKILYMPQIQITEYYEQILIQT